MNDKSDFVERLIEFLRENRATIGSTCQTGCDSSIMVDGIEVAEADLKRYEFRRS